MATANPNFFKAHWDWLVLGVGLAALAAAVVFLALSFGQSPEDGAAAYATRLNAVQPAHEGVAAADLAPLQAAYRLVKTPPALREIDPKQTSFLASERRVVCQKGDEAATGTACGRPIPATSETCPFCGMKQHVVKVEVDSDGDGLPNDWEKKYGLNPDDPSDADIDSDGDGFTNREEYAAGTNPRDPKSHPDYLDSLSVAGELKQTFLPFWFKTYSPIPGGHRFTLQRIGATGYNATYSVKQDEAIDKTGFTVTGFEKKSELRVIAGSKTGAKREVDVSTLELTRAADGKKLVIRIDDRKIPVETQVELAYDRNKHSWKKTVTTGTELDLNGEKYRVVKLVGGAKGCAVTVRNLATKKEKVLQ